MNALFSMVTSGEISLKQRDYYETLVFSRPGTFMLKGGYSSDFLSVVGVSTLHDSVVISDGTVTFENVVITQ